MPTLVLRPEPSLVNKFLQIFNEFGVGYTLSSSSFDKAESWQVIRKFTSREEFPGVKNWIKSLERISNHWNDHLCVSKLVSGRKIFDLDKPVW